MKYRIREQNELKPSGVEWLGDIPKDWELAKLKYLAKIITGYTPSMDDSENYSEEGIIWVKPDNLNEFNYINDSKEKISNKAIKKQNIAAKDSILMCCIGSIGKFGIAGENLLTNQQINSLIFNKNINKDFSKYMIFSSKQEHNRMANGNVVQILNSTSQSNIYFSAPNLSEQQKIAHFLDEKSKIFDDAISKKEQLIAKLELAKQALISEVVTGKLKVIENNAKLHTIKREPIELKPSGIDWVGNIPKDWEVKKLKYLIIFNNKKSNKLDFKIALENIESKTTKYIETKDNAFNDMGIIFKSGDILFGKLRPYLAKVYIPSRNGICVGDFFVLSGINKISFNSYIKYFMVSDTFIDVVNGSAYGTKMPRASWDFVGNLKSPLPNLTEQQQISKYLDEKLIHFDNTIAKTKQSITKLKEAKEALISEAVTGKIEVIEKESKANEYFQRRVLAAYFIDNSKNDIYFGRVKLQKLLYMAEAVNNLDFGSDYRRHAMGPHDSKMIHSIESQLQKSKWFEAQKIKNGDFEKVEYIALENHAEYLKYLDGRYWKQENIEYIFNLMKGMRTLQAEIVATVYSAYIDLSKQNRVSQENLLDEILNHWHDNKKKIPKENWLKAIEWMSEKQLIKV